MNIAILGWGSLIREPGNLPIVGEWQKDGPLLRIEFSRISKKGARADCLTLVIDEKSDEEIRTLYVISQRSELPKAVADLQEREQTRLENIGYWVRNGKFAPKALTSHPKSCERIQVWAEEKGFDAVIWTALGRRFKEVRGVPFTPDAALKYINGLPLETKKRALEYIRLAPEQTMTPFRRLFREQTDGI